jgi:hypothetical protein
LESYETQLQFANALVSGFFAEDSSIHYLSAYQVMDEVSVSKVMELCLPALSLLGFHITIDTEVFASRAREMVKGIAVQQAEMQAKITAEAARLKNESEHRVATAVVEVTKTISSEATRLRGEADARAAAIRDRPIAWSIGFSTGPMRF